MKIERIESPLPSRSRLSEDQKPIERDNHEKRSGKGKVIEFKKEKKD